MLKGLNIVLVLLLIVLGIMILDFIRLKIQLYKLDKKLQELSKENYKEFINRVSKILEKEL
ncbi:hypothetical protein FNU3_46 [Fusobacterium phage vB_FnuS_FNU3]|uniref:Uncharacterized protein n=1 Tax=Fusobacterium phage Fnu1 TaxID=2530024 RepID=A0A481W5S5_9CAUD|nr:hypothetical protein KMD24_gp160 [Fusobacterium phage Fnu1]QBJ04227.1 hypothetical protein [Fusobacterium phage Fnu1]WGH50316.1 hypothetical protein FNU2_85 [Fusobacterium phage vB_FnuS_FNU2]WGH50452.1 hypothetical protein FNU3_46 [Fusobacterium phage vB_FnuS_FNU3]